MWLVPRLSYFRHVSYNRTTGCGADCSSPLTSQSKARVSMSGPTLDRDTMLLRGSPPPHAGSILEAYEGRFRPKTRVEIVSSKQRSFIREGHRGFKGGFHR